MKKLTNANPFVLLLLPVMFALILGVSYQFEHSAKISIERPAVQAKSLFSKSVSLVKTVCSIAKDNNVW